MISRKVHGARGTEQWTSELPVLPDDPRSATGALILVGDDSGDAWALAALLARATDGTLHSSTRELATVVRSRRAGLVMVLGSRHSGGAADIESLMHDASCPVAVAPVGYAGQAPVRPRRIGVAFDGWVESRIALRNATFLAECAGAELILLTVSDPRTAPSTLGWGGDALDDHRTVATRYLDTVVNELAPGIEVRTRVLDGPVAPALATACLDEQLDLLALGSRRRGPMARIALGSVSRVLVRHPPACPLLICPRGASAKNGRASNPDRHDDGRDDQSR